MSNETDAFEQADVVEDGRAEDRGGGGGKGVGPALVDRRTASERRFDAVQVRRALFTKIRSIMPLASRVHDAVCVCLSICLFFNSCSRMSSVESSSLQAKREKEAIEKLASKTHKVRTRSVELSGIKHYFRRVTFMCVRSLCMGRGSHTAFALALSEGLSHPSSFVNPPSLFCECSRACRTRCRSSTKSWRSCRSTMTFRRWARVESIETICVLARLGVRCYGICTF